MEGYIEITFADNVRNSTRTTCASSVNDRGVGDLYQHRVLHEQFAHDG